MVSTLSQLQDWYASQCDGDWEHGYGVRISTLDNPGWCLCIDLEGTDLADTDFPEFQENYDDEQEWLICTKKETEFSGHGGPRQLERMIQIFLAWAQASQPQEAGQPIA